jgi:hypothetical protein
MVTSKLDFPVWKTKENIKVKQNSEIQYKYIVFVNGKLSRWEEMTGNRVIQIKNLLRVIVNDSEGIYC